jgi:[acyl-carrier-protein] S-malonyltransferase
MTAYLFPGQGSQFVGMGKDLVAHDERARTIFARADEVLGFSLSGICFEGPEDRLRQTENTQPAIFVHSLAALALYGGQPSMTAGHSLGEYTALVAAGAIAFEDALPLVRLRGKLMQKCGVEQPGVMAAVVGLDDAIVDSVCAEAQQAGIVQSANFNSPGQVVISGSADGVREAMRIAKERGARMVKELNVSGAFHSPLMSPAQEGLAAAVMAAPFTDAAVPVYANVSGSATRDAGEIQHLLVRQLTSPVRWTASVLNMAADGATAFVEIGPGSVLQGLVKRIISGACVRSVGNVSDLSA